MPFLKIFLKSIIHTHTFVSLTSDAAVSFTLKQIQDRSIAWSMQCLMWLKALSMMVVKLANFMSNWEIADIHAAQMPVLCGV